MKSYSTDSLNVLRGSRPQILVVTDAPYSGTHRDGEVMVGAHMRAFGRYAKQMGFAADDFVFVNPCPPIPDTVGGSDSRLREFLNLHREEFAEAVGKFAAPCKAAVYLGKHAGMQVLGGACAITTQRGTFKTFDLGGVGPIPMLPLFSMAHILRRVEDQVIFEGDFRQLKSLRKHGWDPRRIYSRSGCDYRWCYDLDEHGLLENPPDEIYADTETRGGTSWWAGTRILTVQLCWGDGLAIACPLDVDYVAEHREEFNREHSADLPPFTRAMKRKLVGQIRELLGNPDVKVGGHNFKYDIHAFKNHGIEVANWADDTIQLAFAADDNMQSKSQDHCIRRWVPERAGYADSFNKDFDKAHMERVPMMEMLTYGCGDVDAGRKLLHVLREEVGQDARQYRCYRRVMMPSLRMFAVMERHGITIDQDELHKFSKVVQKRERELYRELISHTPPAVLRAHAEDDGCRFSRDAFVSDILFGERGFGIPPRVFTESTRNLPPAERVPSCSAKEHFPFFEDYTTADGTWTKGGSGYPYIRRLIEYQKLAKMISTYVGLPSLTRYEDMPELKDGSPPKKVRDMLEAEGMRRWGKWWVLQKGDTFTVVHGGKVMAEGIPEDDEKKTVGMVKKFHRDGVPEHHEWHAATRPARRPNARARKLDIEHAPLAFVRRWFLKDGDGGATVHLGLTRAGTLHFEHWSAPSGFWKYIAEDGRVHTNMLLDRATTGRSASRNPNIQNIPKHGEFAKDYRRIFIAPDGWDLVSADLSQAELRLAAWLFNETNMLRLYREGTDIHAATAAHVMGVDVGRFQSHMKDGAQLLPGSWPGAERYLASHSAASRASVSVKKFLAEKRHGAKGINFGYLYGMWWKRFKDFAKTDYGLEFSDGEAAAVRERFFEIYPGLVTGHKTMKAFAKRHGYIRALHGALRRLPSVDSDDEGVQKECERQSINSGTQRFASDLALIGLFRFTRDCPPEIARPALFIHDDGTVEARRSKSEEVAAALRWYMQTPPLKEWFGLTCPIPIVSDVQIGRSLGAMVDRDDIEAARPSWFGRGLPG